MAFFRNDTPKAKNVYNPIRYDKIKACKLLVYRLLPF